MKKILIAIFLCMFAYADNEINFDVVDSKGRSFWDKKFVGFDNNIVDVCNRDSITSSFSEDSGVKTNRTNKTIIEYLPMEAIDYEVKDVIMHGDKFILKIQDFMSMAPYASIEFIDDDTIKFCGICCRKYIMCPQY